MPWLPHAARLVTTKLDRLALSQRFLLKTVKAMRMQSGFKLLATALASAAGQSVVSPRLAI